jgi:hypothetical protein
MASQFQPWGSTVAHEIPVPPAQPTEFERMTERVGLAKAPHLWAYDNAIRRWVKAHKNTRYVPEDLLAALDMRACVEDWQ